MLTMTPELSRKGSEAVDHSGRDQRAGASCHPVRVSQRMQARPHLCTALSKHPSLPRVIATSLLRPAASGGKAKPKFVYKFSFANGEEVPLREFRDAAVIARIAREGMFSGKTYEVDGDTLEVTRQADEGVEPFAGLSFRISALPYKNNNYKKYGGLHAPDRPPDDLKGVALKAYLQDYSCTPVAEHIVSSSGEPGRTLLEQFFDPRPVKESWSAYSVHCRHL